MYLLPSTCCNGTKCISANDTSTFNFSDFDEVSLKDLYNMSTNVHNEASTNSLGSVM